MPKLPRLAPKEEPTKLKVKDFVITDEFDTVKAGASVRDTVRKLLDMKRGVVLVKSEDDNVLGVVTERKILKGIMDQKGDPMALDITKVMDTNIMYVRDNDELETALLDIKKNRPAAVIVNDKEGKFKGYFSPIDYIEAEGKLKNAKKQ
jgi:signal-transduction protein with cAMP-binding, CBS, and nucleotidyltransferase domain